MPIILICVLMLMVWIRYHSNNSNNNALKSRNKFWERESEANHTRNKPLDSIEFISVPLEQLPFFETTVAELQTLQKDLTDIAKEKIANLSQYTNTELKLAYGTGNFSYLAQCDTNYTILMQTILNLANYHLHNGNTDAAIQYFEYAVASHSQNAQTYVSLVMLYAEQNNISKIENLKSQVEQSDYSNKKTLLHKIEQTYLDSVRSNKV